MDMKISPSMLACDFANMGAEANKCAAGGAHLLHLDVMDGHFVPNISFGAPVIAGLSKVCDLPFDVHLMISQPLRYIDWNGLQIDGLCKDVMCAEPIDEKVKAFGFDVVTVDGNDFDQLESAFDAFHKSTKPFCILMKTVKGKGVSFMENECGWHGKATNPEEYKTAMAELTAKLQELEA